MTAERPPRAAWKKVLLGALAPLVFFLVAELGLSLLGLPDSGIYDGDRYTNWRLKPNLDQELRHEAENQVFSIQTSNKGFRGDDDDLEGLDVVALGCSTTFGWGVEEEEAWPHLLGQYTGLTVLNAGVPGHSSHQGVAVALELLEYNPRMLVLGWMVRDAQRSSRADKFARAPSGLRNTRVVKWLSGRSQAESASSSRDVQRVSPADFEANLETVVEAAREKGVPVLLLQFPMQVREPEYESVLRRLNEPVVAPQLDGSFFFAADPIHLNPSGHERLAEAVAPAVLGLLEPASVSAGDD